MGHKNKKIETSSGPAHGIKQYGEGFLLLWHVELPLILVVVKCHPSMVVFGVSICSMPRKSKD